MTEGSLQIGVSVRLPSTVKFMSSAFAFNQDVISVTVPSGVKTISDFSFYNASYIESVVFEQGVVSIGDRAFENCYLLD